MSLWILSVQPDPLLAWLLPEHIAATPIRSLDTAPILATDLLICDDALWDTHPGFTLEAPCPVLWWALAPSPATTRRALRFHARDVCGPQDSLSVLQRFTLPATPNVSSSATSIPICGFYGAKGGVGTTSIALNMALLWAKQLASQSAKPVWFLDASLEHPDSTAFLFPPPLHTLADFSESTPISYAACERLALSMPHSTLKLLPSPFMTHNAPPLRSDLWTAIIHALTPHASAIICDFPSRWTDSSLTLFGNLTALWIITTPDAFAFHHLRRVLPLLDTLQHDLPKQIIINRAHTLAHDGWDPSFPPIATSLPSAGAWIDQCATQSILPVQANPRHPWARGLWALSHQQPLTIPAVLPAVVS